MDPKKWLWIQDVTYGFFLIHYAYLLKTEETELPVLQPDLYKYNPYTNFFYREGRFKIKLCVPEEPSLLTSAKMLGIEDMIWFGHNTDPVEFVPIEAVTRAALVYNE